MDMSGYFDKVSGTGILATCDPGHEVDLAIYAKPHVVDDKTVVFVMKERLSHRNLRANLQAAYMFIEDGSGQKGVRLYLTMLREEKNQTVVAALRKKQPCIYPAEDDSDKFLVYFQVDRIRPLVGDGPLNV
ncbi:MAG: pyridoxamine 5'-phosphate oxidase family protein [Phycisphaerae bacterium]|nr:pyridoxamine 5'-phosphate oxidase family protein [Phycisphaerae bacterium]